MNPDNFKERVTEIITEGGYGDLAGAEVVPEMAERIYFLAATFAVEVFCENQIRQIIEDLKVRVKELENHVREAKL